MAHRPKSPPFNPPDAEKVRLLPHVRWEVDRLAAEFDLFLEKGERRELELTLLHARVLADFFDRRREQFEVVSGDYGYRHPVKPVLEGADRTRINQHLPHLTYLRDSPAPKWRVAQICLPILLACAAFSRHVATTHLPIPPEERCKWNNEGPRMDESAQRALSAGVRGIGATGEAGSAVPP